MQFLKMLWGSRKAQILAIGGVSGMFAGLVPYLVMFFHWDDARVQLWMQMGQHFELVILGISGLWATLVAAEDSAHKFGLPPPPPAAPTPPPVS